MRPVLIACLTRNRLHYLKQTLPALIGKTKYPYRLIVINNGSDDDETNEWLDGFLWEYRKQGISILTAPCNMGLAGGYNLALCHLQKNEVFVKMNDDSRPDRDGWLTDLLSWLDRLPLTGVVGHLYHDNRYGGGKRVPESDIIEKAENHISVSAVTSGICAFSPEAILRIGAFWSPPEYANDWWPVSVEYGYRLRLAGFRSYYVSTGKLQRVGDKGFVGEHCWHTHIAPEREHNYDTGFWHKCHETLNRRIVELQCGKANWHYSLSEWLIQCKLSPTT